MLQLDNFAPAAEELFYSRGDANDIRWGDRVARDPGCYGQAQVIIIGCPQDEGVRRNRGRVGARRAPDEIRKALYRYPLTKSHHDLHLLDLGNLRLADSLEETHRCLFEAMRQFLRDGKKVVILGGGNDISYPDCLALAAVVSRPLVFNIDRHLDVRADVPRNSGTPYRQLLEEGAIPPGMFHEVGINSFANSQAYLEWVTAQGAHIHLLGDLRAQGAGTAIAAIVKGSDADGLFFGFDLDVVRAVEAPGVSDPGPMGLSAREVCAIADAAAADPRTRIIEISEVNPEFDRDGITSKLAANIIVRALAQEAPQ